MRTVPASPTTALQIPKAPERLPTAPEFARRAEPASAARERPPSPAIAIRVRALAKEQRTPTMGIATFDATTGAGFVWMPLAEATDAGDDLLVHTTPVGSGEHCATLATAREFARHGYLARSRFVLPSGATATADVVLDASMGVARFELPRGSVRAGPLRLVRADDPHWLPMQHGATGVSLTAAEPTTLLLGAGVYELQDPIAPESRQRFEVPTKGPIVLSASLTLVRADRP